MKPRAQAPRPEMYVNGAGRVAGDLPCTPVSAVTGTPPGWQAGLELAFAPRGERTALVHRLHHGPLMVQKPFWSEGAPCHVNLLHPPGSPRRARPTCPHAPRDA